MNQKVKNFCDNIRKFLTRNEIFFTTITAISLAFISIFISIQGNINSNRQTEIAERQEKIDYFSKLPNFQIMKKKYWNDDLTQLYRLEIEISKLDGQAKNISISTLTFLDIQFRFPKSSHIRDTLFIEDYFHSIFSTGNSDGKICTIKGAQNNLQLMHLAINDIKNELIKDSAEFINILPETYLKISYTNFLNEPVTNYYSILIPNEALI